MIVFKNYFKIVKANIKSIMLYAVIFLGFGIFASTMGGTSTEFVAVRPNVAAINNSNSALSKSFVDYIKDNASIIEVSEDEIDDALFYREIEYVIFLEKDFSLDSKINTKKIPGSTSSIYIEMLLNRYLNVLSTYVENGISESDALLLIEDDLKYSSNVNVVNSNASTIEMANYYFNFSNYAIIAISIFVVSTIIMAFKKETVNKRNRVSAMSYKEVNRQLFLASCFLSLILFLSITLVSFILFSEAMFNKGGMLLLFNLFVFIFTIQSFALLVSHFIKSRDALTGVVNITALGSSFISGAFVPQFILGSFVVGISRLFPSYYFITNNNIIMKLSNYTLANLNGYLLNIGIMVGFLVVFSIISNYVSKKEE